ncbi:hypothetical protein [Streptomyces sp. 2P-4]|uniref:hypothetical protein n=1 Tax=Streptomyces sp. 2P-4 TaxID=2931974 RepID=UPI00253FCBB3|nr:hypothetical protein [Streptomyces sp. 2P-4]
MFAAVCVLLAATGHVLTSGIAVPWWAVLPAFVGTIAAAWALADRERGLLAVTGATVAVQALLHAGFSLAQSLIYPSLPAGGSFARQWAAYLMCGEGTGPDPSTRETLEVADAAGLSTLVSQPPPGTAMTDVHGMHHLHHVHDVASTAAGTGMPATGHDMAGMSPTGMLAAHLLAAVLCGLWLAYAEQAAFGFVRTLAARLWIPLRILFRLLAPTTPHLHRVHVRRSRHRHALRRLLLVHAITSRGPPTGTAVL